MTTESHRGWSVRARITLTVALFAACGLAVAGLSVYLIENGRIIDRANSDSQHQLDEFAAALDPASGDVRPTLRGTLEAFLARTVPERDEVLIGFIGDQPVLGYGQGIDVLRQDPAFLDAAAPLITSGETTQIEIDGEPVLLSAQPAGVGQEHGALVVAKSLAEDRAELRSTMRTYTIVSLLALLLIGGIAFVRAGRLLAPLRTLRRTAEEISGTDLSRRLPVTGNDDITALTGTVNGMLDRLEAAFAAQRQLLDDIGHELRTPLTVLQGHLELLDSGDPADVAETRALLLDETERMSRLVEDLILLAKTQRPGFLQLGRVEVAALTDTIATKASGLGERDWTVDGSADVVLTANEQRITQALLQLAANAVRHTGPGDVVAIGSSVDDGCVLWWVRDTGPGVAAADRERIFERFGRGGDAGRDDGFGLGLSIVTAIARAHGGDAWLDEAYADGARFVFSVPFTPTLGEGSTWPAS